MKTLIATSLDQLDNVRDDWSTLRQRCGVRTPNTDVKRFETTLRAFGGDVSPYVAILCDQSGPRAGVVARVSRRRNAFRVGYLKIPAPALRCLDVVYGGLICEDDPDVKQALVRHLRTLLHDGQIDSLVITHLPRRHPLFAELSVRGAGLGGSEPHWVFNMEPGPFDDTLKRFSKKHRGNLRRADRKLVAHYDGDVVLRRFGVVDQVDEFMEGAARVAARTYQAGLGVGFSSSPLWEAILRMEAECGRMRCYWLECQGAPVAFQVGAVYERTYFLEAMGFDPAHGQVRPGYVLHTRVLQDLCTSGIYNVDYGFGDAEYKRACGSESWDEVTLTLYRTGLKPSIVRLVDRSTAAIMHGGKHLSNAAGFLNTLKNSWRHRLQRRAQTTSTSDGSSH